MKHKNISEGVLDVTDEAGWMAKSQLYKIAKYAGELHSMIGDTDELEPWMQAKITKAADNLLSLYKSDHLDDETRTALRELEKKLRIVFKEINDIDKKVEEIAKRERMKN